MKRMYHHLNSGVTMEVYMDSLNKNEGHVKTDNKNK